MINDQLFILKYRYHINYQLSSLQNRISILVHTVTNNIYFSKREKTLSIFKNHSETIINNIF